MTRITTSSSDRAALIVTVPLGRSVLQGVRDEVAQDELDRGVVAGHRRQTRLDLDLDDGARPAAALLGDDPGEDRPDEHRIPAADDDVPLGPGEDEEVLDEALQALALADDVDDDLLARRLVDVLAAKDLAATVDRGHRRPELVAQHADEHIA